MIEIDAVDIVQPDICYIRGIERTLRVVEMARAKGKLCIPHSANLSLATIFSLHLMGATQNASNYIEFSIEPTTWTQELFHPNLTVVDGKVQIPSGPGWGININPKWLQSSHYQQSSI